MLQNDSVMSHRNWQGKEQIAQDSKVDSASPPTVCDLGWLLSCLDFRMVTAYVTRVVVIVTVHRNPAQVIIRFLLLTRVRWLTGPLASIWASWLHLSQHSSSFSDSSILPPPFLMFPEPCKGCDHCFFSSRFILRPLKISTWGHPAYTSSLIFKVALKAFCFKVPPPFLFHALRKL